MTLIDNLLAAERESASGADEAMQLEYTRRAIVDTGSNSIRLVVYDGPVRAPFILFNEKIAAGLGAALSETGRIDDTSMERGITALKRFACLIDEMDVADVRCIATAAVREAENGRDFIIRAKSEAAMKVEILSGDQEARIAGLGVISAIPGADGIVADLGGGSLELARVRDGKVHRLASMPLGVLRLSAIRESGKGALSKFLAKALQQTGWNTVEPGLPLYLVGGSWRALAHLDMQLSQFPLPIIHNYRLDVERAAYLMRVTAQTGKSSLKKIPAISSSRAATLRHAAALLAVLSRQLRSSHMIISAHGLREGLLFEGLNADQRAQDPLLAAAEAEGEAQGRFPGHGRLIDKWIAPLFADDGARRKRIRRAACLLGDVAWRANPDFRAERGMEIALHGNWVGIDAAERAMLAQAMFSNFGGGAATVPVLEKLVSLEELQRAVQWGLAIRLAQRLSGGVAMPLGETRLERDGGEIRLRLSASYANLNGEAVMRRLKQLGQSMDLGWSIQPKG